MVTDDAGTGPRTDADHGAAPRTGASWPDRAEHLLRTDLCPSCFAPLGALVCARCGLDVRAPGAAEVLRVSADIVGLVDDRTRLLGSMRDWAAARTTEAHRAARTAEAARAEAAGAVSPSTAAGIAPPRA
ncbi:hypothetical protein, partial [Clavibacter sp. MX14-G9D]|uniref:hypothetical protein n=1 Tax=Clavibacter sp. MX14-G9D TaxID=3064656 RepID=UPI00293E1DAD